MRRIGFWSLVVALSTIVFYVFLRDPGLNTNDRAMYLDLVHGRAHRPFVYRVLVPGTVRLVAAVAPERLRAAVDGWAAGQPVARSIWTKARLEPGHGFEHLVGLALMFSALPVFAAATRAMVAGFVPDRPGFASVAALAALLGVPAFFKYTSYPNDLPTLALLTLGIVCLQRERPGAYLAVFLLAALNKESALLLAILAASGLDRSGPGERRRWVRLVVLQLAILAAVKLALAAAFAGNPGEFLEVHLLRHNREQLHAWTLTPLLVGVGAAVLAAREWERKPRLLRAMVWPLVALVGFNLVFAWVEERRVWLEAWPFLVALLADGAARTLGSPVEHPERVAAGA